MPYRVSTLSFRRAQQIGRRLHPVIKPSHLSEILAAGFGFRTKAALDAELRARPYGVDREWSDRKAHLRADDISSPRLTSTFPDCPALLRLGVLEHLDSWSIERLAQIAWEANEDEARLSSGGHPWQQLERAVAAGLWPTESRRQLEASIRGLPLAHLCEVEAVMWLEREEGLGVASTDEGPQFLWGRYHGDRHWERIIDHARKLQNDDDYKYVLSKGRLGVSLLTGLCMLARWLVS